ncbi:MAG: VOC family protein [Thermoplasmatota archaeon]
MRRAPKLPATRTVTPYLGVNDAAAALEWYKLAFGAKVGAIQPAPGNKIMHAEFAIGDTKLFLSDIFPGSDMVDAARGGASVNLHILTKDIDKVYAKAVANGAKATMPLDDMFWGDRYGRLIDPFGHSWAFSWKSKLSKKELDAKRAETMKGFGGN